MDVDGNRVVQRYPLQWPEGWRRTQSGQHKRAQFGATVYHQVNPVTGYQPKSKGQLTPALAVKRVLDELRLMGVLEGDAIISSNLETRLDGLPRSGGREPSDPGVAVYWIARGKVRGQIRSHDKTTRVMAIDIYDRAADNLAAIAASLEAMRTIGRHGGAQVLERAYTGFDALPPPKSWRDILGFHPATKISPEEINARFRELAAKHHPDKPGGSHERMAEISRARAEGLSACGQ